MTVKFFCPHWGCEQLPFEQFVSRVVEAGYDGVEMSLPMESSALEKITRLLADNQLLLIAQHWETMDAEWPTHRMNYTQRLHNLVSANPLFINSQTGKDYFTEEMNMELIHLADDIASKTNIRILHETHRGKWSFAAHITRQYLQKYPAIRLTLDVSHWCNVAESFLQDQQAAVQLALQHADHLHARVGHSEGPQVTHPAAPEWQAALEIHLVWWDQLIDIKRQQQVDYFTITPEFGAPPYLTLLPFTQQPIANQWDCNIFIMELLKNRYAGI